MSENATGNPDCPQCEGGGFMLAPERDEWPLQPLPMVPCGNCRTPFDGAASRMDWQRIYDRGFEDGLNSPCRPTGDDDRPAPRDGDLTRLIRDAMKRYGVPAVMAEAGRLAQQRL